MPLFTNKFSPKLSKARRINSVSTIYRKLNADQFYENTSDTFRSLSLNLSDEICFNFDLKSGKWIWTPEKPSTNVEQSESKDKNDKSAEKNQIEPDEIDYVTKKEYRRLKNLNERLANENRLLRLKIEILIDLVLERSDNYT